MKIFTKDVFLDKECIIKIWKARASES